jgi:hypothetical protein
MLPRGADDDATLMEGRDITGLPESNKNTHPQPEPRVSLRRFGFAGGKTQWPEASEAGGSAVPFCSPFCPSLLSLSVLCFAFCLPTPPASHEGVSSAGDRTEESRPCGHKMRWAPCSSVCEFPALRGHSMCSCTAGLGVLAEPTRKNGQRGRAKRGSTTVIRKNRRDIENCYSTSN